MFGDTRARAAYLLEAAYLLDRIDALTVVTAYVTEVLDKAIFGHRRSRAFFLLTAPSAHPLPVWARASSRLLIVPCCSHARRGCCDGAAVAVLEVLDAGPVRVRGQRPAHCVEAFQAAGAVQRVE